MVVLLSHSISYHVFTLLLTTRYLNGGPTCGKRVTALVAAKCVHLLPHLQAGVMAKYLSEMPASTTPAEMLKVIQST